jgi:hypothetical protein
MKKAILLHSLSWLLLLNLTACEMLGKEEAGPTFVTPKANTDQLVGEWEWTKTYSGWIGLETPVSKGFTETLRLEKDNHFRRFRDGTVREEKYYFIEKVKSSEHPQDSVLYLHLIDKKNTRTISSQPLYLLGSDTIMTRVSEICDDCPESYFVRKSSF